jgi:hypothetical protein
MLALVAVALPIVSGLAALYTAAKGALRTREALAAHHESDGLINTLAWIDRKVLQAKPAPPEAARAQAPSTEGR